MSEGIATEPKGTCFVVMGFGKRTDFETGRTLDLDKTLRHDAEVSATATLVMVARLA
jgi:hypothetical protein